MPTELPDWIADTLGPIDEVHAVFDQQDSGNIAWGVTVRRVPWFVKLATTQVAFDGLVRAAQLHHAVAHRAIVPLEEVLRSVEGTALLYPWAPGKLLYADAKKRRKPKSAPGRFRALPVEEILAALDDLYDAHLAIAAAGFVSSDFYDGCLIYDFEAHRLQIIDLDEYRPGPFVLQTDRALGSTRFLAPEELRRGATIDQRTTVFHLARAASVLLDEGDCTGAWRASPELQAIAARGHDPDPDGRFETVAKYVAAWRVATRPHHR